MEEMGDKEKFGNERGVENGLLFDYERSYGMGSWDSYQIFTTKEEIPSLR